MRAFFYGWTVLLVGGLSIAEEAAPPLPPLPGEKEKPEVVEPPVSPREPWQVSQSGQFRVTGGEMGVRAGLVLQLEQHFIRLSQLLGEDPLKWKAKIPIDVVIGEKAEERLGKKKIDYQLAATANGFSIGMWVSTKRGVDQELLDRAALKTLLWERALRGRSSDEVEGNLVVRPWVVEGLLQAEAWMEGRAEAGLYQSVFRSGSVYEAKEVLELKEEEYEKYDAASAAAFRVMAGATVMSLLEQPGGKKGFQDFLAEMAVFQGEVELLMRRTFPDLNLSELSLDKWIALTLAKYGSPRLTDVFGVVETEAQLAEALKLRYVGDDGIPQVLEIEEWEKLRDVSAELRRDALKHSNDALVRLSYRSFPSYRPLIDAYLEGLSMIAKAETQGLNEKLVDLMDQRGRMKERMERARDYLDYFEITRAREVSGEFDDYLRLQDELEVKAEDPRTDHVSRVLDVMNRTYERKKRPQGQESR